MSAQPPDAVVAGAQPPNPVVAGVLAAVDLGRRLEPNDYEKRIGAEQLRLRALHFRMYERQVPVLAVFEGWDAAGKGGAIKRVTETLEPRGYTVSSFSAPRGEEKTHHYLWRFWRTLPRAGHLGIFDRSYYGRVLVERVEGFSSEPEWRRAYREINEFEAQQASFGMVVVKFWLHISKEEQLHRFQTRERDPFRSHKLTAEDWRNRARWAGYEEAVEEMLARTSTAAAPWIVVEADDKLHARVKVVHTLADAIERAVD
jgi:AMP-polyphosphate phosphotransferase